MAASLQDPHRTLTDNGIQFTTPGGGGSTVPMIKEATVKRFYYETHDQLREHLANFVAAYNFAKRLKALNGLTPYEYIGKCWAKEPQRFTSNPGTQQVETTLHAEG